ncbi:hypothetical protein ATCC90586_008810 [Pythium insidiosum]|nr:hypothetical protein ATCC90586_008810 [Pythium insidiosum]
MLPVEAKPLLSDEPSGTGDSTIQLPLSSRGTRSSAAARAAPSRGSHASPHNTARQREWSQASDELPHSYTDFVTLRKADEDGGANGMRNELGTINGVYVPCLLNIIGVILFLRLGWGVGQAGVEGMLFIFFMAELQAVLTVLSASTIASNGAMKGGGSYFLISRSLGPEFGGAIGLQYYFLYAVGVSMYLVGFAEEAQQTWFPEPQIGRRWVVVIIATVALLAILAIGLIGANAFAKVNKYLFVLQFACVAIGAVFIYVLSPHELSSGGKFVGVHLKTLKENFEPHFTAEQGVCGGSEACTLAGVYAIVFPLATGFMEGLNLSGDLKNPGRSIPVGTLAAVATSAVIYISLILTFAAAFPGSTLRNNFTFFQEVSKYPFIVITGVLVSCFSSGLGALFGASRILQAIARDDLFPLLKIMGQGSAQGDEPQYAVLFTTVLTQIFILLGDLDVIAPICTSFFCLAYAGVNFTCFLLQVTGVPNFRPTFRYHSWHLSLLGTVLNVGVMIYLNALYAVVSLLIVSALFLYLYMTVSAKNWGDISQALIYHQVRKYLLRLDTRKAHSKFWRPSILLLTHSIMSAEVKLCHSLKKGGLYIIGNVITGEFDGATKRQCDQRQSDWQNHIFDARLKAIAQIVVAGQVREGYRMLMQTSGLGGMQVNAIAIPWASVGASARDSSRATADLGVRSALDFVGLLADAVAIKKSVILMRHADRLDPRLVAKTAMKRSHTGSMPDKTVTALAEVRDAETIDVWITGSWEDPHVHSSAALMMQLAYVLHSNKAWRRRTRIRLIKATTTGNPIVMQSERLRLNQVATALRVDEIVDEMLVISIYSSSIMAAEGSALQRASPQLFDDDHALLELNQTLQRHATRSAQLLLLLPDPRAWGQRELAAADGEASARTYLAKLEALTNNLPSTLLIFSDDDGQPIVSTSI